jgi:phenylpropionate dioxygenase-like ring-hydroxylating dioxygenase large terminal subunit
MEHATEVTIARRWLDLHHAGTTTLADSVLELDPAVYTSPARFAREQKRFFRTGVVLACLTADVPQPGDHVAVESGGVPIVVMRGGDGQIRAFLNACRHRAAQLLEGGGHRARNIVCPFHAWTYGLDGRLLGQPRSCEGFAGVDPDGLGLVSLPIAVAHGLVLVRPVGDEPIDLSAELRDLGPELDSFAIDSYVRYDRTVRVWRCNWKLILDTFLESYHVFALHGRTVGPDYPGHIMVFDEFGPHLRLPVPRSTIHDLEALPSEEWALRPHATIQHFVAPNAMVNFTVDHFILWRFVPVSERETVAEMTQYVPADSTQPDAYWREWYDLHDAVTRDEDYPESERIQRVLESGRVDRTLLGRNEGALQHFHRYVASALDDERAPEGAR